MSLYFSIFFLYHSFFSFIAYEYFCCIMICISRGCESCSFDISPLFPPGKNPFGYPLEKYPHPGKNPSDAHAYNCCNYSTTAKSSVSWFLDAVVSVNNNAVFFNRSSAEPQGSASGCLGFRRNRPKFAGTKFVTIVLYGCSNIDTWITA